MNPLMMNVSLNKSKNSIVIKDSLKSQFTIVIVLTSLNLLNTALRIFAKPPSEYGFLEYTWVFVGLISIVTIIYFIFIISTASIIKIDDIKGLHEKTVFGRKRFSIQLQNGKKRYLGNSNKPLELAKVRDLFSQLEIYK